MSDTENPIDYAEINKKRDALYEIQLKSSDKIESIITHISSIFIGAVASFYAIIGAPIEGKTFWALLFFIVCIVINCISYVCSYWCMQFSIDGEDPHCEKAEKNNKISSFLSNSIVVMDHISLVLFLSAIILASIGTFSGYSKYILEKNKAPIEKVKCVEEKVVEGESKANTAHPATEKGSDVSPSGFKPPPKTIIPPPPKLNETQIQKGKQK